VRLTLVITGEVQIDIRLFVSLKSKERLKWDIKSFLDQLLTTVRAVAVRHITTGFSGVTFYQIRIKIYIMTVTANIMRT
jgi:hypothetical protein